MIATKSGEIRIISTTDIDKIMYSKEEITSDSQGEIVKIIRPSVLICEAPVYRLVIKSKDNKAKT